MHQLYSDTACFCHTFAIKLAFMIFKTMMNVNNTIICDESEAGNIAFFNSFFF